MSAKKKSDASSPPAPKTTPNQSEPPPKPRKEFTPERLAVEIRRLDRALVVVVLFLAFFLASFPASNHDIWMYLATGRLIAQGEYTFGADPFSYASGNTPWINNAWLTHWLMYGLSSLFGGPETPAGGGALVVAKALVIALLAWVLLQIRRPGQSLWPSAACVGLALLAMSPRLLLQPACISFLFLGLTLWLLLRRSDAETRRRGDAETTAASPRLRVSVSPRLLLLPLFVLWANLDNWFLLGPLTVGLFWLGEELQEKLAPLHGGPDAPKAGEKKELRFLFLAGLGVCALNPYHVRAFALPPELATFLSSTPLRDGPSLSLREFFFSPLKHDYLFDPRFGRNVAGWSYVPLVILSLVSFALNYGQWRWQRVAVWLPFFLLSAVWWRAVPFFAVVAGPITALNWQDFAARRYGTAPRVDGWWKPWSLHGRSATILAGLALLALAWPGWLHYRPDNPYFHRRVSWSVRISSSMREAALKVAELRRQGVLRAHGFNFIPDIASYCAWFCPEEKTFFDIRYLLFDKEATTAYLDVFQTLDDLRRPKPAAGGLSSLAGVEEVFRDPRRPIDHLIVTSGSWSDIVPIARRLWNDPGEWTLLYGNGRTVVFGWKDPQKPADGRRFPPFDFEAEAFGPNLSPEARFTDRALEPSRPPDLWEEYWRGASPRPLAVDAVTMYAQYFSETADREKGIYLRWAWPLSHRLTSYAAVADKAALGAGPFAAPLDLIYAPLGVSVFHGDFDNVLTRGQSFGPAGAPVLAMRTARRAVAENPRDPQAFLALASASAFLGNYQKGRWQYPPSRLDDVRQTQFITALRRAWTLNPESSEIHQLLWQAYLRVNPNAPPYFDLAVEHFTKWLELERAAGRQRGETDELFQQRMAAADETLKQFQENLQKRKEKFELDAANLPPLNKAGVALQLGLAQKAMELLGEILSRESGAPLTEQQVQAGQMLIALSIRSGFGDKVREETGGRPIQDPWINVLLWTAVGDYRRADEFLAQCLAANEINAAPAAASLFSPSFPIPSGMCVLQTQQLAASLGDGGDLQVVRGLLALEEGDTALATQHFRQALQLREVEFLFAPMARDYLKLLEKQQ